jgi:hypothetical protein
VELEQGIMSLLALTVGLHDLRLLLRVMLAPCRVSLLFDYSQLDTLVLGGLRFL